MNPAYEEIIDWLARGFTPEGLLSFQPSEATHDRVGDLIRREKNEGLTPEETAELDKFMQLEHLIRLAKARVRHRLAA